MLKAICRFIINRIGWEVDFDIGTNEPNIGDRISTPSDANFFIVDYVLLTGGWDGSGKGKLWIRKPRFIICGWLDNDVITNNTQLNQLATCEFTVGAIVTSLVMGDTLQVGWRPLTAPDRCNLVAESGGGSTIFDLPDRADKMIQVLSRATTYFDARDDAQKIYDILHGAAGWALPEVVAGDKYQAMVIEALAIPQYLGIDEKERHEFSTNYIFRIRDRD